MIKINNTFFIPIGCSCINHFQLDFFLANNASINHKRFGGLLDWTITTTASTIQLLNFFLDGSIKDVVLNRDNYVHEKDKVKNVVFDGLYFWHDTDALDSFNKFQIFQNKVNHLIDNMLDVAKERNNALLIWSNIQPNLLSATSLLRKWSDFQIEKNQYETIKLLSREFFGQHSKNVFLTREEDKVFDNDNSDDVVLFDLPRCSDYQGPAGLYAPLLSQFMLGETQG